MMSLPTGYEKGPRGKLRAIVPGASVEEICVPSPLARDSPRRYDPAISVPPYR